MFLVSFTVLGAGGGVSAPSFMSEPPMSNAGTCTSLLPSDPDPTAAFWVVELGGGGAAASGRFGFKNEVRGAATRTGSLAAGGGGPEGAAKPLRGGGGYAGGAEVDDVADAVDDIGGGALIVTRAGDGAE